MKKYFRLFLFAVLISASLYAQDTLKFSKKYLPGENKVLVFVPHDTKTPEKGLPLVYLLHGYSGGSSDWNDHLKVQDYADKFGFIIVCPDGYYSSWYADSPFKTNNQCATFFKKDLFPAIHKKYKIDSSAIFITGLSMGGCGSINFFIHNQNYFRAAGSMSGILDIRSFPNNWEIKDLLGEYKKFPGNWDKYSCVYNLKYLKNKKKPFLIDCGSEDIAYPVNLKLKKEAEELGLNITFITRPGEHNWQYWTESLKTHLDFFKALIVKK
jgi:putative tributyrin esterase